MGAYPNIAIFSMDGRSLWPGGPFLICQNLFGPIQEFSYTTNYVCVDTQTATGATTNTLTASDCVIQENTLACVAKYYYATNGTCVACAGNTAAGTNPIAGHVNRTCDYCVNNYYKSGGDCVRCPDNGLTDAYGTVITSCYLPIGSGTDATGDYTLTDKCYYK